RLTIHRPETAGAPSGTNPRAAAIAVPTPLDAMPVPGDSRLARPATQRLEPPARTSPRVDPVDEEVTTTGVVLPKLAPRAPDPKPFGLDTIDPDFEETLSKPGL